MVTKAEIERRRNGVNWTHAFELMGGSLMMQELRRFGGLQNSKRVQSERIQGWREGWTGGRDPHTGGNGARVLLKKSGFYREL